MAKTMPRNEMRLQTIIHLGGRPLVQGIMIRKQMVIKLLVRTKGIKMFPGLTLAMVHLVLVG